MDTARIKTVIDDCLKQVPLDPRAEQLGHLIMAAILGLAAEEIEAPSILPRKKPLREFGSEVRLLDKDFRPSFRCQQCGEIKPKKSARSFPKFCSDCAAKRNLEKIRKYYYRVVVPKREAERAAKKGLPNAEASLAQD